MGPVRADGVEDLLCAPWRDVARVLKVLGDDGGPVAATLGVLVEFILVAAAGNEQLDKVVEDEVALDAGRHDLDALVGIHDLLRPDLDVALEAGGQRTHIDADRGLDAGLEKDAPMVSGPAAFDAQLVLLVARGYKVDFVDRGKEVGGPEEANVSVLVKVIHGGLRNRNGGHGGQL